MQTLNVVGRSQLQPPQTHWRDHLCELLGQTPRRLGPWAELGLYGALCCLADAGEPRLTPEASLILGSRRGPSTATLTALQQMHDDLPMPLTFLQTQPSQLLALLAAQWQWRGQACFFAATSATDLLTLAQLQSGAAGVLLGWVDEADGGISQWLRLHPNSPARHDWTTSVQAWSAAAAA